MQTRLESGSDDDPGLPRIFRCLARMGSPPPAPLVPLRTDRREPPRSRSQCTEGPRPCPFVSCRYNLYLDVRSDGVLRFNFPDREPQELVASCALDLAADGPRTLDQIAGLMGMSKERARQIEVAALAKLSKAMAAMRVHSPSDLAPDDIDT